MKYLIMASMVLSPMSMAQSGNSLEVITIEGERSSVRDSLGLSTHVITQDEIALKNAPSVVDYLAEIPGVYVQRAGTVGGQVSIFIRGAKQDQLVITIDGVPVSDPTLTGAGFDLSHMSVADVEAIEVFKGAQSVLFGSDGLGGVINIVTKKGSSKGRVFLAIGNGDYVRFGANTSGKNKSLSYRLTAEQWTIASESDADKTLGNQEIDKYKRQQMSMYLDYNAKQWFTSFSLQASKSEKDLDSFGDDFSFVDDPNFSAQGDRLTATLKAGRRWLDLDWTLNLSQTETDRDYDDDIDQTHSFAQTSQYEGSMRQVDFSLGGDFMDNQTFQIGIQSKTELALTRKNFNRVEKQDGSNGVYLTFQGDLTEKLSYDVGVRRDDFERSGIEDTGSLRLEYSTQIGRFYSIASRAFKAPSLYQSFDLTYGNQNLTAEHSQSFEIGYQKNLDLGYMEIAIFQNEYIDLIEYDFPTNSYSNRDGLATTRGGEILLGRTWDSNRLEISTSLLDMTKNETPLQRRPQNTHKAEYVHTLAQVSMGSVYQWIGKRVDFSGPLEAYETVSLFANWKAGSYKLYGRVDNLLNKGYRQVAAYSPAKRQTVLGAEMTF